MGLEMDWLPGKEWPGGERAAEESSHPAIHSCRGQQAFRHYLGFQGSNSPRTTDLRILRWSEAIIVVVVLDRQSSVRETERIATTIAGSCGQSENGRTPSKLELDPEK